MIISRSFVIIIMHSKYSWFKIAEFNSPVAFIIISATCLVQNHFNFRVYLLTLHHGDPIETSNTTPEIPTVRLVNLDVSVSPVLVWNLHCNITRLDGIIVVQCYKVNIRGYHIRLYHLVIGWHTLECNIWFWIQPH